MSNILKLLCLDKALLKPYYRYFLIIIISPMFMAYGYKDIIQSTIFATVMVAMTSSYTFSIAEKNDLNRLYGLLPVSKNDIVIGRYIFVALMGLGGILISLVTNLLLLSLIKVPFTIDDAIVGIGMGIIIYSISASIQLPGFFKYGAIKGRLFSFIPLIGLFFLGVIAKEINADLSLPGYSIAILSSPMGLFIFFSFVSVVIYLISMGISQRIYNKMEA